ncbi:flavin reductase family protein [Rhodococcus sp. C26F]|uniref:Flavin reductase (DIM6/NTAB) family NADH-FMN oxidoreductase RutF n=1 Tax=Rhodococcus rhodochrous J45 TaxID=935266 RepID=A0A562DYX4_RHORH|nr:flavin reductase family protein [Rhodococcus rhodochrous]TWH14919.1 flavin reductase (DIM6/NTAB) family NADH-FMN oxidoreductase RutF [Rhodococcus rhodochrous J45]
MSISNSTTYAEAELRADFKEAMAHMCAPVTVVTTMDDDRPHGTTVSAVMSLSVEPLLIAVAMATTSDSLSAITRAGMFGVNVLAAQQHSVAAGFSTKGGDKFAGVLWHQHDSLPRLDGSAIWLSCRVDQILPGGDHAILVGAVTGVDIEPTAAPLTYHGRRFGTHTPH